MQNKLIKTTTLSASLCDANVNLSIVGAFQIVEDMVTEMMGNLKIDGVTCMKEYSAMWVFVRNRIEFLKPIKWMEEYTAECFISSFSGVKLNVDTVLKTGAEIALASRLELCAINLNSGRIRKSSTVGLNENTPTATAEHEIVYSKDTFERGSLVEEFIVRSADIDYCHHTNNISYIRYLVNQFSVKSLTTTPVKFVEVQYVNQTYEGETLSIYSCGENKFSICRDDKTAVTCSFGFIPRIQNKPIKKYE